MNGRQVFAILTTCTAALVAYGSLVPLRWREDPEGIGAWRRVLTTPLEPFASGRSGDFFVNILVFLPIGLFASGTLHRLSRSRFATLSAAVVLSALLAVALEVSQILVRDRTPSWSDVAGLTLGGLVGAVLWQAVGHRGSTRLLDFVRSAPVDRQVCAVLWAYTTAWLAVGLLPLLFPRFAYPLVRSVWLRHPQPETVSTAVAAMLATALAAVPLGASLVLAARAAVGHPGVAAILVGCGSVIVLLVDGLRQIAPLTDPPHPAARLVGLAAGAGLAVLHSGGRLPLSWIRANSGAILVAWCAVLVLMTWAPFDFGVRPEVLEARTRLLYERAPLHRYYWAPPLVALEMVLTLLLLALPVGALLSLTFERRGTTSLALVVATSATLFMLFEWGQLHLPGRRADATDVLITAAGAFIGALLARHLATSPPPPQVDS